MGRDPQKILYFSISLTDELLAMISNDPRLFDNMVSETLSISENLITFDIYKIVFHGIY